MQPTIQLQQHQELQQQQEEGQQQQQENTHRKCRTRTVSNLFTLLLLLGALLGLPAAGVKAEEESQDFQKNSKYQKYAYINRGRGRESPVQRSMSRIESDY